jgi:hypothetical protein
MKSKRWGKTGVPSGIGRSVAEKNKVFEIITG